MTIGNFQDSTNKNDERFKMLYQYSKDAMMTLEPPDWNFTSGNPAAIEIFGAKDEQDFTSRSPWMYSPELQPSGETSQNAAKAQIDKAMAEGVAFFEWTHKRLSGEEFPATVLLTKTTFNGIDFLQATVRDIEERKNIERKLKQKMEELERFNAAMVDREKKMVELKQRIAELEEKLNM